MKGGTIPGSTYGLLPPLTDITEPHVFEQTKQRLSDESFFDQMMKRCNSMAMPMAFEPLLKQMFRADRAILWLSQNKKNDNSSFRFYSPTLNKFLNGLNSLISATAIAKTTINCIQISNSTVLDQLQIDPNSPNLFFPLYLRTGIIVAVCQITRQSEFSPFRDLEIQQSYFITKKYRIYGTCTLNTSNTILLASDISHIFLPSECIQNTTKILQNSFSCKTIGYWIYHQTSNTFAVYDISIDNFVVQSPSTVGIVSHALRSKQFINERMSKYHVNYLQERDGDPNQPVLVGVEQINDQVYAVVLRGRTIESPFSVDDDKRMILLMPFVAKSIAFSMGFSKRDEIKMDSSQEHKQLLGLLDVASSLTSIHDFQLLIKKIQKEAASFVKCESARVLLVDPINKEFHLKFKDDDINTFIRKPLMNGISGQVYQKEEPIRVVKPETNQNYYTEIDSITHNAKDEKKQFVKPKNLLSVPIFSSSDKVCAVLNLFNKKDPDGFSQSDEDTIVAFAVFCGIAMQNCNQLRDSLIITKQIKELIKLPEEINKREIVIEIIQKMLTVATCINCRQISLLLNNKNQLYEYVSLPSNDKSDLSAANDCFSKKQTMTIRKSDGQFITCTPLITSNQEIIGVIQFVSSAHHTIERLESFANIIAAFIEKNHLRQIQDLNQQYLKLNEIIEKEELDSFEIPKNMKSNIEYKLNFDVNSINNDMELTKIVFTIFDDFGLNNNFKISNETMFNLIHDISHSYLPVNYFNWKHAVNTLQYLAYILKLLNNEVSFTNEEILSLFLAAIFHDVDHDSLNDIGLCLGFNNFIETKTDKRALEILLNQASYLELHHCNVAMQILSKYKFIESDDQKVEIYANIINLILATNMKNHFEIIKEFVDSSSNFNQLVNENKDFRFTFLKILLKAADLSECFRPFEIADKSKYDVPLEFFVEGKLDEVESFSFWPLDQNVKVHNRINLMPFASTIPFYRSICMPFLCSIVDSVPQFQESFENLTKNVLKWESLPIKQDIRPSIDKYIKKSVDSQQSNNQSRKQPITETNTNEQIQQGEIVNEAEQTIIEQKNEIKDDESIKNESNKDTESAENKTHTNYSRLTFSMNSNAPKTDNKVEEELPQIGKITNDETKQAENQPPANAEIQNTNENDNAKTAQIEPQTSTLEKEKVDAGEHNLEEKENTNNNSIENEQVEQKTEREDIVIGSDDEIADDEGGEYDIASMPQTPK